VPGLGDKLKQALVEQKTEDRGWKAENG